MGSSLACPQGSPLLSIVLPRAVPQCRKESWRSDAWPALPCRLKQRADHFSAHLFHFTPNLSLALHRAVPHMLLGHLVRSVLPSDPGVPSPAERTKKQIISRESYDELFRRLDALPPSVRHVVLVLTVPLVFPELPAQEAVWRALDNAGVKAAMQKTGEGPWT